MKRFPVLFSMMAVIIMTAGCYYDKEAILYPSSACNSAGSTYSAVVSPILNTRCVSGCHNTANAGFNGGVNLDNYASVKTYVDNGKLLGTINHASGYSPMPKNTPKMPDCEIAKITDWVNSGALNN